MYRRSVSMVRRATVISSWLAESAAISESISLQTSSSVRNWSPSSKVTRPATMDHISPRRLSLITGESEEMRSIRVITSWYWRA